MAPGHRLHQKLQCLGQPRLGGVRPRAPGTRGTHPVRGRGTGLKLADALADGVPARPRRPRHRRDPTVPQGTGLGRQRQPALPLIQVRQHRPQLLRQGLLIDPCDSHATSVRTTQHLRLVNLVTDPNP